MKIPDIDLANRLLAAKKQIAVGATYIHYRGGLYMVTAVALDETTLKPCVIYQQQSGEMLTFARSLDAWLEKVVYEGKMVERFAPQQLD